MSDEKRKYDLTEKGNEFVHEMHESGSADDDLEQLLLSLDGGMTIAEAKNSLEAIDS